MHLVIFYWCDVKCKKINLIPKKYQKIISVREKAVLLRLKMGDNCPLVKC